MGFSPQKARSALTITGGDVAQAMELCLDPEFGEADITRLAAEERAWRFVALAVRVQTNVVGGFGEALARLFDSCPRPAPSGAQLSQKQDELAGSLLRWRLQVRSQCLRR